MQPGEWLRDLLDKAKSLAERLWSIEAIDSGTARQVAEELVCLAFDVVVAAYRAERR
jgi:hypothetical protein